APSRKLPFTKAPGARDNAACPGEIIMSKKKEISRRTFLTKVAAGSAACAIVPRHVLGRGFTSPSDTLNVAGVGVGGMGRKHLFRAKSYTDYRDMLEHQKDIDAVMVATPDHMHASIALAAMDLGKHVYVQKPLCWSIEEARKLSRRAKETKVATQMGNQGHSSDEGRTAVEYVWAGAIGDVREVHIWTNRPLGFWPQGVPRPAPLKDGPEPLKWSGRDVNTRLAAALCGDYPVPGGLAWDLFLGTAASNVDYHPIY